MLITKQMNQMEQSMRNADLQTAEKVGLQMRFFLAVKWLIKAVIKNKMAEVRKKVKFKNK